jgi:hypothetical protein
MGNAWEIIDTFVTNPGAAITATAPFPGDTLAVRNFSDPNGAYLIDVYAQGATAGILRIRSPRLHDNVQGIRFRNIAAINRGLLSEWEIQRLYAQDSLITEMSGGAAETDGFGYVVFYDDLPGAAARLIDVPGVTARGVNLVDIEVAVAAGAAVGARSASSALNASFDLLKANTDYAVLGYEVDAVGLSVGMRGIDTGNLRIGGPMTTERIETRDFFARLSHSIGKPMIPIVNSANKGGFLIDTAQVVAGVAANVTIVAVELHP